MRCLTLAACLLLAVPASAQEFQAAFPDLAFDVPITDIQAPDDGSNRLFVAEQSGRIKVFTNDPATPSASVFLDLRDRINPRVGIIGLAFDPAFAQNGLVYVHYNRDISGPAASQNVIARFETTATGVADPDSEEILITVDQQREQHFGGQLQFGPDGALYASFGDAGGQGDPFGNGQDLTTLPATVLRLDVRGTGLPLDCAAGTGSATIPADNPLIDGPGGGCDETFAYGFRNPFRFSFAPDGRLWLGDVGQDEREEVNIVEPGGNYGWNTLEGTLCFNSPNGCDAAGTVLPIREYPHNLFSQDGGFSVTGGYVYRGNTCSPLLGRYVYGDFVTTNLWSLTFDGQTADNQVLDSFSGLAVTTFGEDEQGELYLGDLVTGTLLRLTCTQPVTVSAVPVGPATVPASGGALTLDVTLTNTTASAQTTQAWATADLSDGSERVVAAPVAVRLPAGASVTRRVTLGVPGLAPAGVSTLVVKTGSFPDAASSADLVTVTKLSGPSSGRTASWQAEGFGFEVAGAARLTAAGAAADGAVLAAFPTPFAEQTTVRYALDAPGPVRLAVYDVLGREVAVLAEGRAGAGRHEAVFEAARLPSGVYLVRLDAAGTVRTASVTLLR
ncbi:MAG: PQQ-dependent sugar dehydrogenase [Bacteroidota bacterium]